jgi:hypothetical protein
MMVWNVFVLSAGLGLLSPTASAAPHDGSATLQTGAAIPTPQSAKPGERKEIKVADNLLKTYVGEYEFMPERTLTITLENGSLWGEPSGQAKRQLFAESDIKFFLKDVDVQLRFQKDATGTVTGLLMDQGGRQQGELKKVK